MAFVYILKSLKDKRNYIGSTTNLARRIAEHSNGSVKSTRDRRPLLLLGFRESETIGEAAILEKKYKNSHGRLERDIKSGKIITKF